MKRTLKALISLYPKTWRNRYENEFHALLDDVPPTWRTLFDVFGGAMKMQMKIASSWNIIAAFALAGACGAVAFSLTIPKRYVSTAIIKADTSEQRLSASIQSVESRASLTTLIDQEGLYKAERARMPLEDVIERMKAKDIRISWATEPGAQAFAVSFASANAEEAQRTAGRLASQFADANTGKVLDPATLPVAAAEPQLSRYTVVGLIFGVMLGSLFALFAGLKVWKLAAGLGVSGALVGAAVGYVLPDRFVSQAVVRFQAPDRAAAQDHISQLVDAMSKDGSLGAIIQRQNLYSNESERERRFREHLEIRYLQSRFSGNPAFLIGFTDRDRYTAQTVTEDIVSLLMEESIRSQSKMTLELLDTPSLPLGAVFPNRPVVAGTGLLFGLGCAIALGLWRYFRGPLPEAAAL